MILRPYLKPTQVDWASSLRRTGEPSLRNSAKQLDVTSGDVSPSPLLGYNGYMWIVYLVQNDITLEFYIGVTSDLKQRIRAHNFGGKKFTTRKNGTWILIYAEAYRTKEDALRRERRLKNHGSGMVELRKRLAKSLLAPKSGEGCN